MSELCVCLGCGQDCDERGVCACSGNAPLSKEAPALCCSACGGSVMPEHSACRFCKAHVMTTRCATCLAWNLSDSNHCRVCANVLATRGESQATSMHCPRCRTVLSMHRYRDTLIDECSSCGGVFLTPEVLERLTSFDNPQNLALALPTRPQFQEREIRYLACPHCSKFMNRKVYGARSGVVVDVCKSHGVWFDAGELLAIVQFIRKGGLHEARKREIEALGEARRQMAAERMGERIRSANADARMGYRVSTQDAGAGIDFALQALAIFLG